MSDYVIEEPDDEIVLLERQVVFVDAEEVIDDVSHDDLTAEYVLGQVEDDYDEIVEVEDVGPGDDVETQEVVLLDLRRLDLEDDLELS